MDGWSSVAAAVSGVPGVRGRFTWRRTVAAAPGGVLVVVDEALGAGTREATCFLPLLPGLEARVEEGGALVTGLGRVWRLACPGARVDVEAGTLRARVRRDRAPVRAAPPPHARGSDARPPRVDAPGPSASSSAATLAPGCELRVELRRASGTTVGWLRAGPGP